MLESIFSNLNWFFSLVIAAIIGGGVVIFIEILLIFWPGLTASLFGIKVRTKIARRVYLPILRRFDVKLNQIYGVIRRIESKVRGENSEPVRRSEKSTYDSRDPENFEKSLHLYYTKLQNLAAQLDKVELVPKQYSPSEASDLTQAFGGLAELPWEGKGGGFDTPEVHVTERKSGGTASELPDLDQGGKYEPPVAPRIKPISATGELLDPIDILCERYNKGVKDRVERNRFKEKYKNICRLGNKLAVQQSLGQSSEVEFREADNGYLLAIRHPGMENTFMVVPQFAITIKDTTMDEGGLGSIFNCQGYDPAFSYTDIEVVEPALLVQNGEKWSLKNNHKGALRVH